MVLPLSDDVVLAVQIDHLIVSTVVKASAIMMTVYQ